MQRNGFRRFGAGLDGSLIETADPGFRGGRLAPLRYVGTATREGTFHGLRIGKVRHQSTHAIQPADTKRIASGSLFGRSGLPPFRFGFGPEGTDVLTPAVAQLSHEHRQRVGRRQGIGRQTDVAKAGLAASSIGLARALHDLSLIHI